MTDTNQYMSENAAGLQNPIEFDSDSGADNKGAVQQLIDVVSYEATSAGTHRLFLDEMSPACRDSLFVMLTALQTELVDVSP